LNHLVMLPVWVSLLWYYRSISPIRGPV